MEAGDRSGTFHDAYQVVGFAAEADRGDEYPVSAVEIANVV